MSSNLLTVIPTDPWWVPDSDHEAAALAVFDELVMKHNELEVLSPGEIHYFDAGECHETAWCPVCAERIDTEWWREEIVGSLSNERLEPSDVVTPCCATTIPLNDVMSDPPEGVASWAIQAREPERGELDSEQQKRIEAALGHAVRVVVTRY